MKAMHLLTVVFSMVIISGAWAQSEEPDDLITFLQGTYRIIGQWPESDETYQGTVTIKSMGNRLDVLRTINSRKIKGVGVITTTTADKVKVLTVTFTQQGRKYKATYLISGDLDNYARLSGYLYPEAKKIKKPGLEALFIKHR
jgi:hypothetical protein